jgi:hypothetical protein
MIIFFQLNFGTTFQSCFQMKVDLNVGYYVRNTWHYLLHWNGTKCSDGHLACVSCHVMFRLIVFCPYLAEKWQTRFCVPLHLCHQAVQWASVQFSYAVCNHLNIWNLNTAYLVWTAYESNAKQNWKYTLEDIIIRIVVRTFWLYQGMLFLWARLSKLKNEKILNSFVNTCRHLT